MTTEVLKEELAFFEEQRQALLKTHPGQFALVKGRDLVGVFPTRDEAYAEGVKRFRTQPFLIKQILEKDPVEHVPLLAMTIQRARL